MQFATNIPLYESMFFSLGFWQQVVLASAVETFAGARRQQVCCTTSFVDFLFGISELAAMSPALNRICQKPTELERIIAPKKIQIIWHTPQLHVNALTMYNL